MDLLIAATILVLLIVVSALPAFFRLDPVNLGLSVMLLAVSLFLWLFLWEPLSMCIGLGPVAVYLLWIGGLNLARRPILVTGERDTAALGAALSGLAMIGPMHLFYPIVATIRMGGYVWVLLAMLYLLVVVLLLLMQRPRLVVYNIDNNELRPILADLAVELDRDARWAGDSLALPNLGVQLHLESVPAMRNVSLISSGPSQNQQGWRHLERSLAAALRKLEVPRNVRAMSLVSAGLILAIFLVLAVAQDPQAVAQALGGVLRV